MPYVSPYKLLGSYKHGDEINLGSSFKGTVGYKIRSTSGSTLKSGTVEITCPAGGEETMGWIKWHTPNREQSVVITLESRRDTLLLLDEDGNQCDNCIFPSISDIFSCGPVNASIFVTWFGIVFPFYGFVGAMCQSS